MTEQTPLHADAFGLRPSWRSALSELPLCLPQSAWLGHIPFLFLLFSIQRSSLYVELGVDLGASFLAACEAARRFGIDTVCKGVDTWRGDAHAGPLDEGERVYHALARFLCAEYPRCSLMKTTFDEAAAHFEAGTIDLLHIDGFHTYDAVKHDFLTWEPKLSNRSVVLIHDTQVRQSDFGVWRLLRRRSSPQGSSWRLRSPRGRAFRRAPGRPRWPPVSA